MAVDGGTLPGMGRLKSVEEVLQETCLCRTHLKFELRTITEVQSIHRASTSKSYKINLVWYNLFINQQRLNYVVLVWVEPYFGFRHSVLRFQFLIES